jgi:hypothetical protein
MPGGLTMRVCLSTTCTLLLALAIAWLSGSMAARSAPAPEAPKAEFSAEFDKTIAPLLASRCLGCHNAIELKGKFDLTSHATAMRGGENGAAIVPGNPDDSLLWQYIDGDTMPPKKPLAAAEKEILRKWIADGAKWGTDPIDRFAYTTDVRAGYDWWSLQPIKRPVLPEAIGAGVRQPLDAYIAAKRHEMKLPGSPEADRRTLARRVTVDLIGLPPTPAEMDEFLADASPDAYERLADRLLASPHYGERWGRSWLDVVRFGESDGYEYDKLREHAWPYRDWVISALNRDMPYDEFVRLQLAGDVLRPDDPQGVVATGFLVAGSHDGLVPAGDIMKAIMRQDELEDVVGVIGQSFLGLTVNCARCHDHKFDPIRQREYYAMTSAIAGYSHGERNLPVATDFAAIDRRISALRRELHELEDPVRKRIAAERTGKPVVAADLQPVAAWDFRRGLRDIVGEAQMELVGGAKLQDGALRLDGKTAYAASAKLRQDIHEKTLEAVVSLDTLDQQGGGAISLQTLDGGTFDAIVFAEREQNRWMAGSEGFARTRPFVADPETKTGQQVHLAIVYRADGTIAAFRDGQPYGKPYQAEKPVAYAAGSAQVLLGLRHMAAGGNRLLAGKVYRAALYDRALADDEIAALAQRGANLVTEREIVAALTAEQRAHHTSLQKQLDALSARRASVKSQRIYTCVPQPAGVGHILARGNPQQPLAVVSAGGVASIRGVVADFGLPPDAPEGQRRAKLAAYIANPANPLFSRVMVNRLWHYHFGEGIVDTPSDFGFSGSRPTSPELLDFLADEFIHAGFSQKRMHRAIVDSATYRQSSAPIPAALKIDGDNRYLWRKAPQRLEAEVVRDAMLAAAGTLNTAMGGPGFQDFRTYVFKSTQFYEPIDAVGPQVERRTVYRTWARGGRNPLLDTLDCPDPSTTTPKRAVTTTPLQAMAMWNNAFVLRMAERLAARAKREAGGDAKGQIAAVYRLTLCRNPTPQESQTLAEFVTKFGLNAACRVMLNSNEFMYVD